MNPALFLDRDGVIIENRKKYVRSWKDVTIFPQALQALIALRDSPYGIFIITNQSVVGRGLISFELAEEINNLLVDEIRSAGGRVDDVFMCPHDPETNCSCRKPEPGLILQATEKHNVDLGDSILIGDTYNDLLAGYHAGVGKLILVRTGLGSEQQNLSQSQDLPPFATYDTMVDAVQSLLTD